MAISELVVLSTRSTIHEGMPRPTSATIELSTGAWGPLDQAAPLVSRMQHGPIHARRV